MRTSQIVLAPPPFPLVEMGEAGGGRVLAADASQSGLERQIDELARSGRLYGLTEEEIKIVEGR